MSLISSSPKNFASGVVIVATIVAALASVPPASAQKSPSSDAPPQAPNFQIGTATGTELQTALLIQWA
jgi:hypothetical protein